MVVGLALGPRLLRPTGDAASWRAAGESALEAGDRGAALEAFVHALPHSRPGPERAELTLRVARLAVDLERLATASTHLEAFLEENPEHPERRAALALLSRVYEDRGRDQAALLALTRLVGEYPDELPDVKARLDVLRGQVEAMGSLEALGYVGY